MDATLPRFQTHDIVVRKNDRSEIGTVVSDRRRIGGEFWVNVRFDGGRTENVLEDDLATYEGRRDIRSLLAEGCFGSHRDFLRSLTLSQLRHPLREAIYSLDASLHSSTTRPEAS